MEPDLLLLRGCVNGGPETMKDEHGRPHSEPVVAMHRAS